MKRILLPFLIIIGCIVAGIMLNKDRAANDENIRAYGTKKKKTKDQKATFTRARAQYEYDLLKDLATGKIPYGIHETEMAVARTLPAKQLSLSGILGLDNLNTYIPAGPVNIGGRTRALMFDRRFNNSSNRVIISGCVSGGILRSSDAGLSWIRVSPENDIHTLTALAQDPRTGSENTWYAGGGEAFSSSADAPGAPYLGHGVWKSIDNGVTWTKLTFTVPGVPNPPFDLQEFDHPFDYVHKIVVNPANGHVYVAGHRRLVRSTNGGSSWELVFEGSSAANVDNGQMDVVSTSAGRLYLGVNGGFPDRDRRGIWTSTTGNVNQWTRIAGGLPGSPDSIPNWRANDPGGNSRRILLALAPSNQNLLYTIYENGLSQDNDANPRPEIDMFKLDVTSGSNVWTNLSPNMPDFPGQMDNVDPLDTQDGYNMTLVIKPDDPNTVFVGGTNLYRSTSGFTNTTATAWIAGYGEDFQSALKIYPASHPDMHNVDFMPNNSGSNPGFTKAICANDGGLQSTNNIMATGGINPVTWTMVPNYQTLQYYQVAIDPASGKNNFIGGAQDNGTHVRLEGPTANEHFRILGGDGGNGAIGSVTSPTVFTLYGSLQFGELYRDKNNDFVKISPAGLTPFPGLTDAFGEFVTYLKLDQHNTEDLYYVNFNRLFRTKNASGVTSSTWEELTGVREAVNPANPATGTTISIRTLELSRGPYLPNHSLYIGTSNGKIFRLDDPRSAPLSRAAVNISPAGMEGSISDIAVNPNNDEEVLAVVSNYTENNQPITNIWWTNNAKSATPTWRQVDGNLGLPSIRSCMIVVRKDATNNPVTEYYVGTSIGLYSTLNINSGTVTWVREGGNVLNFAIVTSLDYRPQDNTLLVGTHGNGMYYATTGTPDFRPNQNTGVTDPNPTDENFIKSALPTLVKGRIDYQIGNMFTVKALSIRIYNLSGQLVVSKSTGYQSGQLYVGQLSKGAYILTITSQDNKQQFVRKFVKE
jgi:hypothetical protein